MSFKVMDHGGSVSFFKYVLRKRVLQCRQPKRERAGDMVCVAVNDSFIQRSFSARRLASSASTRVTPVGEHDGAVRVEADGGRGDHDDDGRRDSFYGRLRKLHALRWTPASQREVAGRFVA